ncbi:zinc-binding dehydrogenase [Olivibacter sp. CPCC 100613]|uniref:zinc-binding dehydrogenase n=1 Tax=Olivibacter sp. CPCC 100613 TaxID=3079931 RepID=UPI002FF5C563
MKLNNQRKVIRVSEKDGKKFLALHNAPTGTREKGFLLIDVAYISLNYGEVIDSLESGTAGDQPGWEFSGLVKEADADSSFKEGDHVAGMMLGGAWASQVTVAESFVARVPTAVSLEVACCIPITGLTAYISLSKQPQNDGRNILITAATGNVGRLAIQIASHLGIEVTAFVQSPKRANQMYDLGANHVVTDWEEARKHMPFDRILEGLGGASLGKSLELLSSGGICVSFGNILKDQEATFNVDLFRIREKGFGGTMLYGFFLGEELSRQAVSPMLNELFQLVATNKLQVDIATLDSWENIQSIALRLLQGGFKGKVVLKVGS